MYHQQEEWGQGEVLIKLKKNKFNLTYLKLC